MAIAGRERVRLSLPVSNTDRAVGTYLSGEIARARGADPLTDESIHVELTGAAGQSLGAFLAAGVTLDLRGDANDYVGKGLSGGRIIVRPGSGTRYPDQVPAYLNNLQLSVQCRLQYRG